MNRALKFIISVVLFPIIILKFGIKKILRKDISRAISIRVLEMLYKKKNKYIPSFHLKDSGGFTHQSSLVYSNFKIGIVFQGPIGDNVHFLLDSIKHFKKIEPNSLIILSTWSNEREIIDRYKSSIPEVIVIYNENPKYSGIWNSNYQIVSSLNGAKKAQELGCDYVLKIRTDSRMYKHSILTDFVGMINKYPVQSDSLQQKGRIIVCSQARHCFYPFFVSDFFFFGTTEDIVNLFSLNLVENNTNAQYLRETIQKKEFSIYERINKNLIPETYILKSYAEFVKQEKLDISIKNYWTFLAESCICVSYNDVSFYKNKGENLPDENQYFRTIEEISIYDGEIGLLDYFDFFKWHSLYIGNIIYKNEYEKYIHISTEG